MDSKGETPLRVSTKKTFLYTAFALGILAAPAISFLWVNHKDHILGLLPFAIFLLCPILHLFLHRKHGKDH
jgi:hypothetical protein